MESSYDLLGLTVSTSEQTFNSLVGSLTPAADCSYFNTLVSFVDKVDYSDIPNPHPIYVIVQFLTSSGPGVIR